MRGEAAELRATVQVGGEPRRERRRLSNMTFHGRRRKKEFPTAEGRAEVILLALEGRSDQDIAAHTGVSAKQVQAIREELRKTCGAFRLLP